MRLNQNPPWQRCKVKALSRLTTNHNHNHEHDHNTYEKTNNHGCMCVYCNNTKKLILMGGAWRSAEASSISKQSKQAKKEEGMIKAVYI